MCEGVKRDDWDVLTFNRNNYYDIWALMYSPLSTSDHPYYVQQDYSAHSKHRVSVPQLEQNPTLYVQQFFYLFKQQFPDVSLTLSRERKGTGIFETDCCPIYIVSW